MNRIATAHGAGEAVDDAAHGTEDDLPRDARSAEQRDAEIIGAQGRFDAGCSLRGGKPMATASLERQIRVLQAAVIVLSIATCVLAVNLVRPLVPSQRFRVIEAERIEIRDRGGSLRAALSNAAGFTEGQRAQQPEGARIAGLMFYNEEGQEAGGLVYLGKSIGGGQDAEAALTFDQYRQDQTVYLHHEEHRDAKGARIEDGLSVLARPDWTAAKEEYGIYDRLDKLPAAEQERARLEALKAGKVSTGRLFVGVKRGIDEKGPYDDGGVFVKNKWGRAVIKLYVDYDNRPHFEVYDPLGKTLVYELKVPAP